MRPSASLLSVALACNFLSAALVGEARSQPGTLISHKKLSSPTLTPVGVTLNDHDEFGDHAVGLGDLDGAGASVAAIAVSAIGDDDGGGSRGAVYVLFLNAAGDVLSHQKISDTAGNFTATLDDNDQLGTGLAWLGDLDGAGPSVGALAVGAINDDDGGADRGALYILFLNAAGSVLSHTKISNTVGGFTGVLDNGDEFGGALCGLGDLDGPGSSVAALAVGANRDDDGGLDRGAVWILYLNSAGTVLSHAKISSVQGMTGALDDTDSFGEKLASLGDLDGSGPGVAAIASSTVYDDDGGSDRGAVYVVFLNSTGGVLSFQKISSTAGNFSGPLQSGDSFGAGLATLGDLDGSGPSAVTLAVGASNTAGAGFDRGAIYNLFLESDGNVLFYEFIGSETGTLNGAIDNTDEFGSALGSAGDIDGPGGGALTLLAGVGADDDGGLDQLADRGAVYLLTLDGVGTIGVGEPPAGPRAIGVARVLPNPFRVRTTVSFRLSETSQVKLDVFDLGGRLVRRLVDRQDGPGEHQITWNGLDDSGRPLTTGCYLVRMTVDGRVVPGAAKAVLLR